MTARKLFIILVTVAALLTLYIIYGLFNNAPAIRFENAPSGVAETNVPGSDGKMGKIGTARIGTITKAVYTDLDENKNIKREFGFERLLHENGHEWTIEKPYMNIIEKDFVCNITADIGNVQVEMVAGKLTPGDAKLSGNVIIHLLPDQGEAMSESFIYLDDISFVSEKSLFTTDGPVRFVSADAEMAGKGLEVVYNTGRQPARTDASGDVGLSAVQYIHGINVRTKAAAQRRMTGYRLLVIKHYRGRLIAATNKVKNHTIAAR